MHTWIKQNFECHTFLKWGIKNNGFYYKSSKSLILAYMPLEAITCSLREQRGDNFFLGVIYPQKKVLLSLEVVLNHFKREPKGLAVSEIIRYTHTHTHRQKHRHPVTFI